METFGKNTIVVDEHEIAEIHEFRREISWLFKLIRERLQLNMETYFERDDIAIHYRVVDQILVVEFKIPPISEEFRSGMSKVIEAIVFFKTGRVIFDTRRFGICLLQDQEWVAEHWYPQAKIAGYCRVAFVNPGDVLTNISIEETTSRIRNRIPTATFKHLNDAIEWMNVVDSGTPIADSVRANQNAMHLKRKRNSEEALLLRYLPAAMAIAILYGVYDFISGDYRVLNQALLGIANFTVCYVITQVVNCSRFVRYCLLILLLLLVAADLCLHSGLSINSIFNVISLVIILAMLPSVKEKQIFFLSAILLVAIFAWIEVNDPSWLVNQDLRYPAWLGIVKIFVSMCTSVYVVYMYIKKERFNTVSLDRKLTQAHLEIVAYNRQLKDVVEEMLEQKRKTELINQELVFERTLTLEVNNKLADANDEIKLKNEQIQAYNLILERIIEELKDEQQKVLQANCKLEEMNTELNANNEFIAATNEMLQRRVAERSDGIIAMNKKIAQYAFFTSHELRGPLARILGLVNLMKFELMNHAIQRNELILLYLDKLLFSAAELDEQVRRAVHLLNDVEIEQSLLEEES